MREVFAKKIPSVFLIKSFPDSAWSQLALVSSGEGKDCHDDNFHMKIEYRFMYPEDLC